MAKDLPYFKFFVSEWSDGDITLESHLEQGVFINVCSYYWSNGCVVDLVKLRKKFRDCEDSINVLIDCGVIKIVDNFVSITFLDEQLEERGKLSKQNRINALNRWNKVKESETNATASKPHSENHAIKKREEERREEKKEDSTTAKAIDFDNLLKYINKTFGREFRVFSKAVKDKYKARVKEGYTSIDIKNAIDNCKNETYHIETNFKYCTLEFFSRSNTLDKYSNVTKTEEKPKFNPYG